MFSSTEFFRFFENGQKQSCVTWFTMQEHFSQTGNESKIKNRMVQQSCHPSVSHTEYQMQTESKTFMRLWREADLFCY